MICTLALFIAVQTSSQAPPWVGKWTGHYTLEHDEKEYHFEVTIAEKGDVSGSYDFRSVYGNDWQKGQVHGNASNGSYKILFKYGSQPSWGQITGNFKLSDDKLTLNDETAEFKRLSDDPKVGKPKPAKIMLKRPSKTRFQRPRTPRGLAIN